MREAQTIGRSVTRKILNTLNAFGIAHRKCCNFNTNPKSKRYIEKRSAFIHTYLPLLHALFDGAQKGGSQGQILGSRWSFWYPEYKPEDAATQQDSRPYPPLSSKLELFLQP